MRSSRPLVVLVAALALLPAAANAAPRKPRVAHVVVIVFENQASSDVLGSPSAPTFTSLAKRYVDFADYNAVAHPSLPNYLALVSGSTQGITDDCTECSAHGPSIGTLLTRAGLPWGAYAEGYPASPLFAKKHVPFLYFAGQAGHVHPLADFRPASLPAFSLVVPDLCHDMHNCPVATGDHWLAHFVPPLLRLPRTVVFIVFDEGTSDAGGGGHVAALAVGSAVRTHHADRQPTNHYGLLRTIEDALGLPHLGASQTAHPLSTIWATDAR